MVLSVEKKFLYLSQGLRGLKPSLSFISSDVPSSDCEAFMNTKTSLTHYSMVTIKYSNNLTGNNKIRLFTFSQTLSITLLDCIDLCRLQPLHQYFLVSRCPLPIPQALAHLSVLTCP